MWNLEHGPNGERDVSFWDYKLPFSTCSFRATSLLRLIFDKSTRFVSISTSTKINSEQLHIGSVAKKTWIASMFWLNWASYHYGRPDGLTFKKNDTEKTPTRRISWFRETLYPWRIWSTRDPMPTYTSQDAEKDLKLSEWNIANFMEMKTLSHNGFSNNLKHVANSKEKQRSCRWCSVIRHKSSSPPRNDT